LLTENRFLLVSLVIDTVLEKPTICGRREMLREMTSGGGLQYAYSGTLNRIKAQVGSKSKLGMDMLMWLSHSERPLKTDELCDALGVEIGSIYQNSEDIPTIETLLGCSLGLVVVEASTSALRLVHRTLQEYLRDNTGLFCSPHATIAQVCLTYLNFQCVRALPPIPYQTRLETSFLEYASCYWGIHARRGITESVNKLAVRLLDGFDQHVSSGILLSHNNDNWDEILGRSDPTGFTGLHGAAYLGMVEIAVRLLELRKWDLSTTDVEGNTAISWAVRQGHEAMVKMLLVREDAAPNTPDRNGRTPLSWAVGDGHEGIAKMLLAGGVSPNIADKDGQTPFFWAIRNLQCGIVKTLLERDDITPNTADKDDQTPLQWSVRYHHVDMVEKLLGRKDVSPNTPDKYGRTPLHQAIIDGRTDIVKLLFEREDVRPNTADKYGQTPLHQAVIDECTEIVTLLLGRRDINPCITDKNDRTPLLWAVVYGHGDIVEMLLERADVAPGTQAKDGTTPLSWAAGAGNEDIVKMLLERGGVAPDTTDENGQTPLSWAAEHGHIQVIEMLQEWCSIHYNMGTTAPPGQTTFTQTSGKPPGGATKQRFRDPGSVSRSGGSSSSIDLDPPEPSESFRALPGGSQEPEIHSSSAPDEPPLRPYTISLLNFAVSSPLWALFLSFLFILLLRILAG